MAFQAGTRVDPRLMQADYSGFARAAQINAQALANLGAQIGGAIKDKREKKEEARLSKQAAEMVLGLSDRYGLGIDKMEDAKTAVEVFGGGKNAVVTLSALAESFQDTPFEPRSREIGGVTYVETEPDKFERLKKDKELTPSDVTALSKLMERPEFQDIKFDETTGEAYMEVPNKETLRPFDKKRVPVPQEIQQLPGFDQFSRMRRTATAPRDYGQMGMRVVK